ncbi:MAG: type II toxin-antitoxin system PemK/MazF family toxin [Solirubrobacteraceae bacterium]
MTRGEIYTAAARGPYTGKPRPVVILQDDRFDATASVTVCPFTTNPVEAPLLRLPIDPSGDNGLEQPSQLMVDKVTTVPRSSLGERLGKLRDEELVALNRSLIVFLGLASAHE